MRKPRTARLALACLATSVLLALTACGPAQGPAGTVADKDHYFRNKAWHYWLTTQDARGERHRFRVLRSDYNACYRGSAYPKCTEVR
jgi:hypothetical protein